MMCSTKTNTWQNALINAVTDPNELLDLLQLDRNLLDDVIQAGQTFPLKVPREFIQRMEKGNPLDPLLLQVLPLAAELENVPGFQADPLEESKYNPVPGLLHKYQGRVLVTLTGTCGVNCRYCFRRSFPYETNNPGSQGWEKILDYIARDHTIEEVIFSGGDPLVANDSLLKKRVEQLAALSHIKRLRIHSRMPVVLPERISTELLEWISQTSLLVILVIHANHPNEISPAVKEAMRSLKQANVTLLNQSVLLKNINDNVETLVALSHALFDAGVLPYYLHTLDKVQGAAHFDLDRDTARRLHAGMRSQLPGYLVPKLACEQPGEPAKVLIQS